MRITVARTREMTRMHARWHAYTLLTRVRFTCIRAECPGRKRARPRAGVTLFSNFSFMGYRLVSICRFVTTPRDLHGQIGLLHAATFPTITPFLFLRRVLYNHLSSPHRSVRSPPDISLRDNLFFLPFFLRFFSFFSLFFPFVRAALSWKIMLGRALCISNARESDGLGDRS